MTAGPDRPTVLLVGGAGGLVGRALLPELVGDFELRSVHRHADPAEARAGVRWVPTDLTRPTDWSERLDGVDVVVTLAWYRWARPGQFRRLYEGLHGLLEAAATGARPRFVHISVPSAPPALESGLPYLAYKRAFDRELAASGLSYRILRPSLLFGRRDRLLSVMLRLMRRYHRFPMFGDGNYHVSPVAVEDLARIVRREATASGSGTIDIGGPERFRYRDLTDRMFAVLGLPPKYWHFSPRASIALGQLVQDLGSTLLYAYEVEWLLSDRLGLPDETELDPPLRRVEPFLRDEAERLGGRRTGAIDPLVPRR
ncbi:MAG: NAD(P)H-binding protein [Thermoplasmata archaeon]|nr:NAD(P)H-binding protein [Thermoplasmata archaeon]